MPKAVIREQDRPLVDDIRLLGRLLVSRKVVLPTTSLKKYANYRCRFVVTTMHKPTAN